MLSPELPTTPELQKQLDRMVNSQIEDWQEEKDGYEQERLAILRQDL